MKYRLTLFLILASLAFSVFAASESECQFAQWTRYKNTQLKSHPSNSAYLFTATQMRVDADGAPNAYHPDDIGLDYIANAGYPNTSWWSDVLVADPENPYRAYTQTSGKYAGYFISKTSLQDRAKPVTDVSRYVDATIIPYLVFPGSFLKMKGTGRLGDLGIAINLASGESSPFVVADIGPSDAHLGEVSLALAEALGGAYVNPKNGAGTPKGKVLYVIFPNSSRNYTWPLSGNEIERAANTLLQQVGDTASIRTCADS